MSPAPIKRPSTSVKPLIEITQLRFRYAGTPFELHIPRLEIAEGERVAVVGPSGSGKTTLLNLLAGIVIPQAGTVTIQDDPISQWSDAARRQFRISQIGMVFQQFELIPYLTIQDNVELPYRLHPALSRGTDLPDRVHRLLASVGLSGYARRYPHQLSQGEQQRAALCRAVIHQPRLILADEPTGNLDRLTKQRVIELLLAQVADENRTLVVVTHDLELVPQFDRTIDFADFQVSSDGTATPDLMRERERS